MDIKTYNALSIVRELQDLTGLINLMIKEEYSAYLMVNLEKYICFYANEIASLLKEKQEIKYSKIFRETRGKMKPFEDIKMMVNTVHKYTKISNDYFIKSVCPPFRPLANDIGLFYCNGFIISNTIGTHMENSHIMSKNIEPDREKIIDISREAGRIVSLFGKNTAETRLIADNNKIVTKDERLLSKHSPIFYDKYLDEKSLIYLNSLCSINYCSQILLNNTACPELRMRLCYLTLNKALSDSLLLHTILPIEGLAELASKFNIFTENIKLRNSMYHFKFDHGFNNKIDENKLFGGLIEYITDISDQEYIQRCLDCLRETSVLLSEIVVRQGYLPPT
ncbi:hypothetical protein IJ765_02645 [Candidatus Saccharibacteria bacterium]|nr:hypothetical protein [Candidatus Saccharibacteria bacterium]